MYDEYRAVILRGELALGEEDFVTEFSRKVFAAIMEQQRSEGGFLFEMLGQTFSPDEMGRLTRMEQKRRALTENGIAVLRASIDSLRIGAKREEDRQRSSADFLQQKRDAFRAKNKSGE
jgi:hypothetical protein